MQTKKLDNVFNDTYNVTKDNNVRQNVVKNVHIKNVFRHKEQGAYVYMNMGGERLQYVISDVHKTDDKKKKEDEILRIIIKEIDLNRK